ncbi:uncharacterized protein LOC661964 [Tribolium castaneum]|uniref:uncharacterized protein LOC661964 n=1 Tax=Tribolium castaneum TaxID=7070 RepID=UPI0030FE5309
MKDLTQVTKQEQSDFFNSFDHILCDVDGVIWLFHNNIRGSIEAIQALKKLKKKIIFVSNNATKTHDDYFQQLKSAKIASQKSDLVQPTLAIIDYLKKINFSKEIYLIGMTALQRDLEKAGFKISEYAPDQVEENVPKFVHMCVTKSDRIGAVIADLDVNLNFIKLQKAGTYLRDPSVIFLTGGSDKLLHYAPGETIIGPGNFHRILENMTDRKALSMAKPGPYLSDFIKNKYEICDSSRVLFIGDTVMEDMGFGSIFGCKKLLVFSGLTRKEVLIDWPFPEEFKPDYYVDSLNDIYEILNKLYAYCMKTFKLSKVTTKISIFFILTLLAFSLTMMRDLTTLSDKELEAFFASFDQVLTDVDGVLWNVLETIPGTDLGIKSLKKIGKKVTAVSNNTTKSLKVFQQQFKSAGIDLGMDEIVTPALVMVSYLKSQNFDKEIFLLGMPCLREIFENAGFKVAKNDESVLPIKTLHEFASATSDDNDNIGAVVTDVDLNLNYPNLQKAATLLKRPQVIFLMGAMDVEVPIGLDRTIIGPGCFHKILEQISGRRGLEMAKPSLCLNDFIVKKCGLTDPRKVLFIGDSVLADMGFATKCGYKKLLVLSGLTKKEDLDEWKYEEEYKPEFYVNSLKVVHELIEKIKQSV